jgi:hypothetical protein
MTTGIHNHGTPRRAHARAAASLLAAVALSACAMDEADLSSAETSDSETQRTDSAIADTDAAITASYRCTAWSDIDAGGRTAFSICRTMPSGYRHGAWSDCTSGARVYGTLLGNNQTSRAVCPAGSRPTMYSYRLIGPPAPECRPGKPC